MQSVRAFKAQERFTLRLQTKLDSNSIIAVSQMMCSQWLSIRLDILGSIVTVFIAILAAATGTDFIPAAYVGLGLSFAFQLTQFLKFAVRISAMLEAHMNSVERVQYYIDTIPCEEDYLNVRNSPIKCCSSCNTDSDQFAADKRAALLDAESKALVSIPGTDWPVHGRIEVCKNL